MCMFSRLLRRDKQYDVGMNVSATPEKKFKVNNCIRIKRDGNCSIINRHYISCVCKYTKRIGKN